MAILTILLCIYLIRIVIKKLRVRFADKKQKIDLQQRKYFPPQVEQPEKIYATLNEIREKLGVTKFKGIQKQGWLFKKSKKNKKWKCLYFVLTDILYFYDNPKRTKPRGLIDLNCSYMYQVCYSMIIAIYKFYYTIEIFVLIYRTFK